MKFYPVVNGEVKDTPIDELIEYSEYQVEVDADQVYFSSRPLKQLQESSNRWKLHTPFLCRSFDVYTPQG